MTRKRAVEDSPARELLELLAGPFRAHAIYAAAKLGIADRLADGPRTSAELAEQVGADADSLARLLRLLAGLGIVTADGDRFGLTSRGALLRSGPGSMRDLAICYGEQFYPPLAQLPHSIRTGEPAFPLVFGKPWVDYYTDHPEAARLFDGAMAAGGAFFAELPRAYDFTHARTVVDIGGGNGALLAAVLAAHPHLTGIVLEAPHVVHATRDWLRGHGLADRCQAIGGDFFASIPPAGDVYLLSRILHDWNDERCLALLNNCRQAMDPGSELLIIERVIPAGGQPPSLALEWDIHMLANTGGRERTEAEYHTLLHRSDLQPRSLRPLPLDMSVLVVGPTRPSESSSRPLRTSASRSCC
jgi:O-methyltransferase/methyltransferase family protein